MERIDWKKAVDSLLDKADMLGQDRCELNHRDWTAFFRACEFPHGKRKWTACYELSSRNRFWEQQMLEDIEAVDKAARERRRG